MSRPELEPTIYRTRGEHANHYTTDVVLSLINVECLAKKQQMSILHEPTIYRTRGEHANHYTIDVVQVTYMIPPCCTLIYH